MLNSESNRGMGCTRRTMIKTMALGSFVSALPRGLLAADKKLIGLSVQLYSVRGDCKVNFDEVLEKIAKMGFGGSSSPATITTAEKARI